MNDAHIHLLDLAFASPSYTGSMAPRRPIPTASDALRLTSAPRSREEREDGPGGRQESGLLTTVSQIPSLVPWILTSEPLYFQRVKA
jgi:hypothetical protein